MNRRAFLSIFLFLFFSFSTWATAKSELDNCNSSKSPLTGTKTIGVGGTYTTFTAAINDLNSNGVGTGGVTFNVTGDYFEESTPEITASGSSRAQIKFISTHGTQLIPPGRGFKINGGDYITIDGIDVIAEYGNSSASPGYEICGTSTNGATHNTIQNSQIIMGYNNYQSKGIYMHSGATSTAGANNYNHFYNMDIQQCFSGIYMLGSSVAGCYDIGNKVGSNVSGNTTIQDFGGSVSETANAYGVYAAYQSGVEIFDTHIGPGDNTYGNNYGIYLYGTGSSGDLHDNVILSLSNSTSMSGIYISSVVSANIYANEVAFLNNSEGSSYGINFISATTGNIYNNFIHNITTDGTGSVRAIGIYIIGGTTNTIYNNMIRSIEAHSSTSSLAIEGIHVNSSSGSSVRIYYNTVKLSAIAVAANVSSAAIYTSSVPSSIDLRNNIFVNKSETGSGTSGKAVAFWRSTTSLTNLTSFTNNNLYYAGTPSSKNLIFYNGTTSYQTLDSYQALVDPIDQYSVTENVPFVSATDLHILTTTATQVESGGIPIISPVSITTDYDGNTRSTTNPEIGADEGAFTLLDLSPPIISYELLESTSSQSSRILSNVYITDLTGVNVTTTYKPRIYYKKSTDADVFGANNSSTNGWKWAQTSTTTSPFTFLLDYSKLRSVPANGDVIQYFVVAQDLKSPTNVGATPHTGFVGTNVSSISSAPISPSSYQIEIITTTKTIGTGGDYPTITSALADLNALIINGPWVFNLLDTNYSVNETFPLTVNANSGSSSINTITFKPNTGVNDILIMGNSSTAIWNLTGASYVTINGSNGGHNSQDITCTNTNTTAPVIYLSGASASNTIKNCFIYGSNASSGSGLIRISTTATGNSNLISRCSIGSAGNLPRTGVYISGSFNGSQTVQNCSIIGMGYYGIYLTNASSDGVLIEHNTINGFGSYGIYLYSGSNIVVDDSEIYSNSAAATTEIGGINCGSTSSVTIKNCQIHDIVNSPISYLVGIYAPSIFTGSFLAYNNEIYLGTGVSTSVSTLRGIDYNGNAATSCEVYFNSVYLSGSGVTSGSSYAFYKRGAVTTCKIENNIFMNTRSNETGAGKHYAIAYTNTTTTSLIMNRNDYISIGTGGWLGLWLTMDINSMTAWRGLSLQDINSFSEDPFYSFGTRYLQPYIISPVLNTGTTITGITDDVIGVLRNLTTPSIGAYEDGISLPQLSPAVAISPSNGSIDQATTLSLNWANGGGFPTHYHIFLGSDNPPTNIVNGIDIGLSTSYNPVSPLADGTTYYWQIIPEDSIGTADDCPIWSFTTISTITTPVNITIIKNGMSVVLQWDAVPDATGYNVYWAMSPDDMNWSLLSQSTENTFIDTNISNHVRFYRVTATQ